MSEKKVWKILKSELQDMAGIPTVPIAAYNLCSVLANLKMEEQKVDWQLTILSPVSLFI